MKKLFSLLLVLSLALALSAQAASAEEGAPTVYFTADISPEGLQRVYDALNWTPGGKRLEYAIVGSHAENYTDWLILSHFNLRDMGMILATGCGTPPMTKRSRFPQMAYELGKKL